LAKIPLEGDFFMKIMNKKYFSLGIILGSFLLILLITCIYAAKIQNEKLRKLANKMFILFAFGLSALMWFVLNKISAHYFPFDEIKVLLTGAFSIVIHAFGDGIINKTQAKEIIETVEEIVSDGKIDDNDKHAVADFWNKTK
jgi:hypothetical protein